MSVQPTSETHNVSAHVYMTLKNLRRRVFSLTYTTPRGEVHTTTGTIGGCYKWAAAEAKREHIVYQIGAARA